MIEPIALTLDGFRGYFMSERFDLTRPIIILGPNAHGKSSISDAVEFLLSEKGTLNRFGERDNEKSVGRKPMLHVLRNEGSVALEFRYQNNFITVVRPIETGQKVKKMPPDLQVIVDATPVPIVLRGHELRHFAESRTPQERYTELTEWLGADALLAVQSGLHKLKRDFKAQVAVLTDVAEHRQRVQKALRVPKDFTRDRALRTLNALLSSCSLPSVDDVDLPESNPAVADLLQRARQLEGNLLIGQLQRARDLLALVDERGVSEIKRLRDLDESIKVERQNLALEVDVKLLLAAMDANEKYLTVHAMEACPVCDTPWSETQLGSQNATLAGLKDKTVALEKQRNLLRLIGDLESQSKSLLDLMKQKLQQVRGAIAEIAALPSERALLGIPEIHSTSDLLEFDANVLDGLRSAIQGVLSEQDQSSIVQTLRAFLTVYEAYREIDRRDRIREYAAAVESEIEDSIVIANEAIRDFLQAVVDDLSADLYEFYKTAQEGSPVVPRIKLVLSDDAVDQRSLKLEVFFHGDDVSRPKSYLSDSQLNSLALGLRLAAIKKFNADFKFLVLDDVVTSYDADHRTTMAKAILAMLDGFSYVMLTHDERFFAIVRERSTAVEATQIMKWSLEGGPQRTTYRGLYERIDSMVVAGENPGNLIRHAEEEWLRQVGVQLGIYVPLLPASRAHAHERAKLAEGLIRRLKELKQVIPDSRALRGRFVVALKDGTIENFSSHFQDDPASIDSVGDQRARWDEFSALRSLFECSSPGCTGGKWHVVNDRHATCTKCGNPMALAARAAALWPNT